MKQESLRPAAIRILTSLSKQTGGLIRTSKRGVPHLVVGDLSIVYFFKKKLFRAFTNYSNPWGDEQKRFDFDTEDEAAAWIKQHRETSQSKADATARNVAIEEASHKLIELCQPLESDKLSSTEISVLFNFQRCIGIAIDTYVEATERASKNARQGMGETQ